MPEFQCPGPITVEARITGGSMELAAEPRDTAMVEITPYDDSDASKEAAAQTRVELTGDRLVITGPESSGSWPFRWRAPKVRVVARVPTGSSGRLKAAGADVSCRGEWASISLSSASGTADFDQLTGDLTVKAASGDLRVAQVGGRLTIHSASGDIIIGKVAGSVDIKSASGNLQVEEAASDINAKTASGDVRIGAASRGTVRLTTVSGDISVGVVSGTGVWMDLNSLTGRTRSDLSMSGDTEPANHQLTIHARAVSGNVDIHRVTLPTAH